MSKPSGISVPSRDIAPLRHATHLISALLLVVSCQQVDGKESAAEPGAEAASTEGAPDKVQLRGRRVEVAVLRPSGEVLELEVPGEVEGNRDAWLASALGGYVEKVLVKEGDRVVAGQALLHVDRQTHALRERRARLQLEVAAREHQRAIALGTAIPTAEVDGARDQMQLAEASLGELSHNLRRSTIQAPFAGTVVAVEAEVGEVAPPGAQLIRLVQLDPIFVTVALSDRDISLAEVGSRAQVHVGARSGVLEGQVAMLAQAADLKTRAFEAKVTLPNPNGRLLPGMIASVSLASKGGQPGDARLVIAQDWLITRRNGVGVFVEEQGKARWRSVELGQIMRRQVVVESGLKSGDSLIIVGHRDLVDGDDVLVHRRGQCCRDGRATFVAQGNP